MRAKVLSIFAVLALLAWVPVVAQLPDEPVEQQPIGEEQYAPIGEEQYAPEDQGYAEDQPVTEDPMAAEPAVPEDPLAQDPMAAEPAVPEQDPLAAESEYATDVTAETEAGAEEELPRTASPLALLAMLGGAGVASGFGIRRLRRK